MKNSGIEWIGNIPDDWCTKKIGGLYAERNTKVSDKDYPPLSVTMKGIVPQLETAAKTDNGDNRKLVKIGDFAINSRSDRRGSCGISSYDGSVSLINTVLMPNANIVPEYFGWVFKSSMFSDEFYKWGHGIVDDLWTTNWNDMKHIMVPFPPISVQHSIAETLNSKCFAINSISTTIEAEIKTLNKYKRSLICECVTKGLDKNAKTVLSDVYYLGEVNAEWMRSQIGYVCTKMNRSFDHSDTALICSNSGTVCPRSDDMVGKMVSEDNAMQGIHAGDIAIHGMDTWHGAIALSKLNGKITRVVHVCESSQDSRFIVYWLQHLAYQGVYKLIANGVRGNTSDFRSWDFAKRIYIYLPSMADQKKISDYLDNKCQKIDLLIKKKQHQLELLADYRKSLIYEYVTGKKEVKA